MTERPRQPRRTTPLAADTLLGSLTPGPRDSQLEVGPPSAPPRATALDGEPPFALPRGGWVGMRMSGGLRFTSHEVVIFRDGRVVRNGVAGTLTDAEMGQLRVVLEPISFGRLPATTERQKPDAYAYEIAARPKRRAYVVEVVDGGIPPALAPLVVALRRIMLAEG